MHNKKNSAVLLLGNEASLFFFDSDQETGVHTLSSEYSCICRIHKNMLMDLSKDIMMDLGITVIGDIIAILKHAKQVYRQVRSVFNVTKCSIWVYLLMNYFWNISVTHYGCECSLGKWMSSKVAAV